MVRCRPTGAAPWTRPAGDILFTFVTPPGMATRYSGTSDDLELLEVALPEEFRTEVL